MGVGRFKYWECVAFCFIQVDGWHTQSQTGDFWLLSLYPNSGMTHFFTACFPAFYLPMPQKCHHISPIAAGLGLSFPWTEKRKGKFIPESPYFLLLPLEVVLLYSPPPLPLPSSQVASHKPFLKVSQSLHPRSIFQKQDSWHPLPGQGSS